MVTYGVPQSALSTGGRQVPLSDSPHRPAVAALHISGVKSLLASERHTARISSIYRNHHEILQVNLAFKCVSS